MADVSHSPGTVIIPWYATGLKADALAAALDEVAPVALRYGADSYAVYRSRDDHYKFQQLAHFASHLDWERYWEGPEMTDLRMRHSSAYQVPVLYGWWDLTAHGGLVPEPPPTTANGHGNGVTAGSA